MMKNSQYLHSSIIALFLGGAVTSNGAVTYVENVNIPIPANFGGVYIDLSAESTSSSTATGAPDPAGDSFTVSYSEPATGDWDFNFFFGGIGIAHNSSVNPYRADSSDNFSVIHALGIDETLNGVTATPSGASPLDTPSFGGSGSGSGGGSGVSTSANHVGTGANEFTPDTMEYLGFVLDPGTASEQFGWMLITVQDDETPGMIHEYALSDSPFRVGAIPEPSASLLLVLGSLPILRRKRA